MTKLSKLSADMKNLAIILIAWFISMNAALAGGLPVVDVAAITAQKLSAERDYLEQLLHEANQQTEILKLVQQVKQLDSYLARFGDPGTVRNLEGIDELQRQLAKSQALRIPELKKEDIQPDEVFRPLASRIAPKLEKEIVVDGKVVAARDGNIYGPEVAERRTHADFQQVRASVLTRREKLRNSIAGITKQIQQAKTASEVQKLGLVLTGLQTELQATDHELEFAVNDVQARVLANATEREIVRKATVESERAKLRVSTEKDAANYRLFTTPIHFSESP